MATEATPENFATPSKTPDHELVGYTIAWSLAVYRKMLTCA